MSTHSGGNLSEVWSGLRGAKILITGHSGFKGSWLSYLLTRAGADVFGFSLNEPTDQRHVYWALGIKHRVSSHSLVSSDVRDIARLETFINRISPDYVVHLAAQAVVSESYRNPVETFATNVLGTVNVLEVTRDLKQVPNILVITSDKAYLNKETLEPYSEEAALGGYDPYSASKAGAEWGVWSYRQSFSEQFEGRVAVARAGNVFGGGDWTPNRLIPDCVRSLTEGAQVQLRMPEAIRPWTFVNDVVSGYAQLLWMLTTQGVKFSQAWNFASGDTLTVMEVASLFCGVWGGLPPQTDRNDSIGAESGLLLIDPSKATDVLGWKCAMPTAEALAWTARWYSIQAAKGDVQSFTDDLLERSYAL